MFDLDLFFFYRVKLFSGISKLALQIVLLELQFVHFSLDYILYLLVISLNHPFQCVNPAGPVSRVIVKFISLQHIQESVVPHDTTIFHKVDKVCK